MLLAGLCLGGFALIMLGLHLSYTSLLVCAALLGLANSVYHPADYAILSTHMDEARMGRAFSVHTFAGFLGGAVAPATIAALVATIGGLGALMVAGALGPAIALLLVAMGLPDASKADRKAGGGEAPKQNIITPAIMMLTIFFMLLGLSNAGISNFGVVALMSGYDVLFSTANMALTGFLGASAIGVLAGGFLADRTRRHGQVAAACFADQRRPHSRHRDLYAAPGAADRDADIRRIPQRPDRALARHAGARRRPSGRGRPRLRHRLHRLQFLRHIGAAAVRLDHGPAHAALGVRRVRRLHVADGDFGADHRPQAAVIDSR